MQPRTHSLRSLLFTASTALSLACAALAQTTTVRISVASGGSQADDRSSTSSLSADGRYVAFGSLATNLVPGDANATYDVFLRDTQLQTTVLVSRSSAGVQGNSSSGSPKLSADGSKVFFMSNATNLVGGDTNGFSDVFVHDVATGVTARVSTSSSGAQAAGASYIGGCSADGRVVVFESHAFNLVSGDTNNVLDVFAKDLASGTVTRASVSSSGAQSTFESFSSSISGDGRWVVFSTSAALAANDLNALHDTYIHDLATGVTELVSVDTNGFASSSVGSPSAVSSDGRYVAFASNASNLSAVGPNGGAFTDIFVRDRVAGVTVCASVAAGGVGANDRSEYLSLSANGQFVAFDSFASNLVLNDTNANVDVFVRDWRAGLTQRVSLTDAGAQANSGSQWPAIGANGKNVVFESVATDLVPGDTNNAFDIFLRSAQPPTPYVFCTAGTTSNGCVPSISASAQPSVSLSTPCTIHVANVEGLRTGVIFYGVDNTGFAALPWGPSTSFLCVKSPTQRTPAQSSGGTLGACDGQLALDWNAFRAANPAALGSAWSAGASAYLQAWFRDPPSPKTTMLSDAIELVHVP